MRGDVILVSISGLTGQRFVFLISNENEQIYLIGWEHYYMVWKNKWLSTLTQTEREFIYLKLGTEIIP